MSQQQLDDYRKVLGLTEDFTVKEETTTSKTGRHKTSGSPLKSIAVPEEIYRQIRALAYYLTLTESDGHTVSIADTIATMLDACIKKKGVDAASFIQKYSGADCNKSVGKIK